MELKNTLKYHLGSKGPEKYHMVRKIRDRSTYVTSAPAGRGYPSTLPLRTLHYASKFHDMRHVRVPVVPFELRGLLVVRADLAERRALERASVPHFPGNETWSALSCVNMTSMTPGRVMLPRRSNATDRIPAVCICSTHCCAATVAHISVAPAVIDSGWVYQYMRRLVVVVE